MRHRLIEAQLRSAGGPHPPSPAPRSSSTPPVVRSTIGPSRRTFTVPAAASCPSWVSIARPWSPAICGVGVEQQRQHASALVLRRHRLRALIEPHRRRRQHPAHRLIPHRPQRILHRLRIQPLRRKQRRQQRCQPRRPRPPSAGASTSSLVSASIAAWSSLNSARTTLTPLRSRTSFPIRDRLVPKLLRPHPRPAEVVVSRHRPRSHRQTYTPSPSPQRL